MCFEIILDLFTQLMTLQYFQLCLSYGMVLVPLPIFSIARCSRRTSFLSWIRPSSPSTQSSTLRWYLCFVWSSIMKFLLPIICSISKTVITASAVTLPAWGCLPPHENKQIEAGPLSTPFSYDKQFPTWRQYLELWTVFFQVATPPLLADTNLKCWCWPKFSKVLVRKSITVITDFVNFILFSVIDF